MDEETLELDNATTLCRICFAAGDYDISSYQLQINEQKFELKDIFGELSSLETWEMNNCPSMTCNTCMDELGQCYAFIQKLRKADETIKLSKEYPTIHSQAEESCDSSDLAAYEVIECLDEKESDNEVESEKYNDASEDCISSSETILYCYSEPEKKTTKRKKSNKSAPLVLTENVKNILSNSQKSANEEKEASSSAQPPIKISKESNDGNCFLITKFVPAQPTILPEMNIESNRDDLSLDPSVINHVRMFDMAAVEVKASAKIELNEGDDESNMENPNTMYMCQYCPRAFATSHHLIMHQRKSHVCQFCMKGFNKVLDLHKHSREAHSQFNCALCKKNFSSNSNLRQHMKRIHTVELPAHVSLLSFRKKDSNT